MTARWDSKGQIPIALIYSRSVFILVGNLQDVALDSGFDHNRWVDAIREVLKPRRGCSGPDVSRSCEIAREEGLDLGKVRVAKDENSRVDGCLRTANLEGAGSG